MYVLTMILSSIKGGQYRTFKFKKDDFKDSWEAFLFMNLCRGFLGIKSEWAITEYTIENTTMRNLKITLLNYFLIRIGIKTLELRACEKIADDRTFMLTTKKGRPLAKISLRFESSYDLNHKDFGFKIDEYSDFTIQKHYSYLANTWFWRSWVNFYLKKDLTPTFYAIVGFEKI